MWLEMGWPIVLCIALVTGIVGSTRRDRGILVFGGIGSDEALWLADLRRKNAESLLAAARFYRWLGVGLAAAFGAVILAMLTDAYRHGIEGVHIAGALGEIALWRMFLGILKRVDAYERAIGELTERGYSTQKLEVADSETEGGPRE